LQRNVNKIISDHPGWGNFSVGEKIFSINIVTRNVLIPNLSTNAGEFA
jgi:hypothetical protein